MKARQLILEWVQKAQKIVYLSNPDPSTWEPMILGLAGKPLTVVDVGSKDKIHVKDPEEAYELIAFDPSEVSDKLSFNSKAEVKARYDLRLKQANYDPDEGSREHDEHYRKIKYHVNGRHFQIATRSFKR